jgi:hypothetical protein
VTLSRWHLHKVTGRAAATGKMSKFFWITVPAGGDDECHGFAPDPELRQLFRQSLIGTMPSDAKLRSPAAEHESMPIEQFDLYIPR